VSSLSLGGRGWVQAANFAAAGMLYFAGAAGLARSADPPGNRFGAAVLGATGVGLLGSAAFRTDPVSGYPPGTPDVPASPSVTGAMHTVAGLPIFLGIPVAALACAWRSRRPGRRYWSVYCGATGVGMLTSIGLTGAGLRQSPRLVNFAGLFQRAAIVTGFSWLTVLSLRARQQPR
jgi:hypothetical protein